MYHSKFTGTFTLGLMVETGAKKIGLVFWGISSIKNGFRAFC